MGCNGVMIDQDEANEANGIILIFIQFGDVQKWGVEKVSCSMRMGGGQV
jgi:hypothetical protein